MFFWNSCFFNDLTDVGNLISCSSGFSKSSLNIWKLLVHILLKPKLENFQHYFTNMWDGCNCVVVWTILSLPTGLIQASQRKHVEISMGQSSFLPGRFPLTVSLKGPMRDLAPLPRGTLTMCPITPGPPGAVELDQVLLSSEPDLCHQPGHFQLTINYCCVPRTELTKG